MYEWGIQQDFWCGYVPSRNVYSTTKLIAVRKWCAMLEANTTLESYCTHQDNLLLWDLTEKYWYSTVIKTNKEWYIQNRKCYMGKTTPVPLYLQICSRKSDWNCLSWLMVCLVIVRLFQSVWDQISSRSGAIDSTSRNLIDLCSFNNTLAQAETYEDDDETTAQWRNTRQKQPPPTCWCFDRRSSVIRKNDCIWSVFIAMGSSQLSFGCVCWLPEMKLGFVLIKGACYHPSFSLQVIYKL